MDNYQIGLIVGSLRKESLNVKLAAALQKLVPSGITFKRLEIRDLPLYNQDDDNNQADSVKKFKADITACHGILFVTPEYNRSIPGVLKNAIDNASRPYGKSAWANKPAGVLGISPGAAGTALAQQHLRNILAYLDMPTLGQPEVFLQMKEGLFDEAGNIGKASHDFLQGWMDKFVGWIKMHQNRLP